MSEADFKNKKVLVMGLGLHGGGVESARFAAKNGARVVCTDLRDEATLASSIGALKEWDIRYVLGRHDEQDFEEADIIIKNPAVAADNPLIAKRTNVETDISLFLKYNRSPVIAITGSKGKSTVVSALYYILQRQDPDTRLGGNITVSPLSFIDELKAGAPVILELSSWQLADLRSRGLLRPKISCITNLMKDHQNRYASFADYEADKAVIFENAGPDDWCVFPDDDNGRRWSAAAGGTSVLVSIKHGGRTADSVLVEDGPAGANPAEFSLENLDSGDILPDKLKVPGEPFRLNALFAGIIARLNGCSDEMIRDALAEFGGVPYRMEMFLETGGIRCYDDTAATIPDAAAAAVQSLKAPVILIAGGTDKELDFAPFDSAAQIPKRILMLAGNATEKWMPRLKKLGASLEGPFETMEAAVLRAREIAETGDAVLLSPGATSFGMFRHEFHRGDVFKAACRNFLENHV